ncbi:lipid-transfer protein [Streptomyces pluripotens]|uniref:Lipid-transfer protein n=1 Tax=Streptomyces pluripotens TaxID=1355015 RepID=A0A221P6E0_9ACTN|nr:MULTISPECIES: thiolase domain-containing protein [Streptomyces]ARP73571.1 lipid-transfer protein [Streptomyces pluripotens]ASN27821.1 lipid-transfer protein [Streptomyces pluripotens]KIE26779.1 lipid-transfer protein [Streptomyces sp. MUSC 125]MCH0557241.1 thiolase domain-containing protein [Streptomyces sp. MUM 16J]
MTGEEAPTPRDVAVVAFAQTEHRRSTEESSEVEMLMPVLHEVLARTGLKAADIGFTCSGSSDYLAGRAFSFTLALDGVGAWPPISESHVEADGAWALYEAWTKLLTTDADTALVYSYGTSSSGSIRDVLTRQLDPYYLAPLWPDAVALAALQAQALVDAGDTDETALAAVGARSRADATANPHAQLTGNVPQGDYVVRPLRTGDCPPVSDGAAAVILAAGERARELCERPAWIRGIDHRIEAHALGVRDLTDSPSARLAAEHAGAFERPVDTAELHAPFSSQEVILRKALRLDGSVRVNPSGGALAANPVMAAGLIRIGEAAARIHSGESDRALAHATSGPCLQQNLVAVLEGDPR